MGFAGVYATVFAPELFVLYATALLAGYEWRVRGWTGRALAVRLGAVLAGWLLAFAVYAAGPRLFGGGVPGGDDLYASAGLVVGFAVIWLAWTRHRVGSAGPGYCLLLVATSVVHAAVVPVWDVSSHVLYATVPVAYLATVDRRFAGLLVFPAAMAWSRVATGAHSALESVGGLALGALLVAGAVAVRWNQVATARPSGRSE